MISNASVLIVDDVPANIQLLAEALKSDYRLRIANHGAKALEIVNSETPPDLILLDIMMPGIDGYEVCQKIKENPRTSNIPIIFVTAKSDVDDEAYGLNLGAVDYIPKPFHFPVVRARVKTHVNLKLKTDLLENLALIDGLTFIPNRRRFDQLLIQEWDRARRESQSLALAMIDVDHFKAYNDHYGHGAGDDCLRKLAGALKRSLQRPGDVVARYGGEEFVLLLPNTDESGACATAKRASDAVSEMKLPHERSGTADHVTISIGIAATHPQNGGQEALLKAADDALYDAKGAGRNQLASITV
ncbi:MULTISPECIES: diguanylate cyclase domain-containing protein [Thiorhodovibrio]|uniref:diguanylate cyclase domain-containing protein n=1 Tax=Thiorhodovibrio TaxID=61593 RepID=UPI00191326C7|nr:MULTISPECIES: PleD family two-component system response regulator [Thiorhodovibrio]MBK5971268.1 diguanylate cyclase response regulator [Thiorhodovibrio winogradskyi]WPL13908.1 Bacteriophytochrome cph2 [Thiorhodovibrio litoralis]